MSELARFHDAPIYEAHRALSQLQSQLTLPFDRLTKKSRTPEWRNTSVTAPKLQFFRRDWTCRCEPGFRWYSYIVDKFADSVLPHLRTYFSDNPDLWRVLEEYFSADKEAKNAIKEARTLLAETEDNSDKVKQGVHHHLLTLLSKIPTAGFLLSPLHNLWRDSRVDARPVAFLVHLKSTAKEDDLPSYLAWTLYSNRTDWDPLGNHGEWLDQKHIRILTSQVTAESILTKVALFFQHELFPCFSYTNFPPQDDNESPATHGHREEKLFGFLILPLYLFQDDSKSETAAPLCAGDWAGVIVVHLAVNQNGPLPDDASREKPSLCASGVIESLRYVWPAADNLMEQVIDSEARRITSSAGHSGVTQAFHQSLGHCLGWSAEDGAEEKVLGGKPVVAHDRGLLLELNWDWPKNGTPVNETVIVKQPDVRENLLPTKLREIVEERTFWICNRVYRSVFTLWHAEKNIREGMPLELTQWMRATNDWFSGNSPMHHTFSNMCKNDHKEMVKKVFPFLPDEWWSEDITAQNLHDALEALFGGYSMVWDSKKNTKVNSTKEKALTVGGLFLLFLLALYKVPSRKFENLVPKSLNFEKWYEPVIPPVPKEAAQHLYMSLYALFREIVAVKGQSSQIEIKKVPGGIKILLGWDSKGEEFFRRYREQLEAICRGTKHGKVVDNCVVLALLSTANVEDVFTPWPLFKIHKELSEVFLTLGGE